MVIHLPKKLPNTHGIRRFRRQPSRQDRRNKNTTEQRHIAGQGNQRQQLLNLARVAVQISLGVHKPKGPAKRHLGDGVEGKVADEIRKIDRLDDAGRLGHEPLPQDIDEVRDPAVDAGLKVDAVAAAVSGGDASLERVVRLGVQQADDGVVVRVHLAAGIPRIPPEVVAAVAVEAPDVVGVGQNHVVGPDAHDGAVLLQVLVPSTPAAEGLPPDPEVREGAELRPGDVSEAVPGPEARDHIPCDEAADG